MYVCMYICMYVYVCVWLSHTHTHARTHARTHTHTHTHNVTLLCFFKVAGRTGIVTDTDADGDVYVCFGDKDNSWCLNRILLEPFCDRDAQGMYWLS
jgi:general stress protein 26